MIFEGQSIQCRLRDKGIAEVCFDNQKESVNKFDRNTLEELGKVIDLLKDNNDVKAAMVTSGKPVFIVGADITEFLSLFALPREELLQWVVEANKVFSGFESLPFPTAVAINGISLGGGMEMCLSCDLRVASTAAQVGLPETKLGLIPGFGGTTRLPRVIGADNAFEWIAAGKPKKPAEALKQGAIDALVEPDDLITATENTLLEAVEGKIDWKKRRAEKTSPLQLNKTEATMSFMTSKAYIAGQAGPHYPAPVKAVEVVEKGAALPLEEAIKFEHEAFVDVAQSSQAGALVQLFLNDQVLKKKAKIASKTSDVEVKNATVLGAGIMGGGIAYQSASRGVPAVMKDINPDALEQGMDEAIKLFGKGVKYGKISNEKMAKGIASIKPTLSYEEIKHTDIVVEAVVENPKVKESVLAEVEGLMPDDAIICSNTSTISIDRLAKALKRPEKFCGMHFFNPVHKMPLVEVIRGEKTSDETVASVVAYASKMGKSPVVVNDCPGFFVNRVLFPYFGGFSKLVRDGADFQKVDKVMSKKFGWPMGPAYLLDVVGMDTGRHAAEVMAEGFPDRMSKEEKDAIDVMFENDRYGQKSGSGFYVYGKDKKGRPTKEADPKAYELLKEITADSKDFDDDEIIARTMLPMIIETIRCLEEGIIDSPAEGDMALVYGLGFPPFRGGVFKYVDEQGIEKIVELAKKYQHLGKAYEPTEGMLEMAKAGKKFYQLDAA
ncbi:fatty acid oxidation complex subunit alpha FadB [Kangiella sediminilitoris]|uniref:enoyl-CoA hydratase n=1 Tax=Kangiella sediminilitoris TaxID=1144748 RepID=A0A1B3B7H7_9GAMM|nr:fatty acid oxidation complex subunit alpha FadB [Kangiella sediminilitoris]AOE48744.1 multifunctional fatty acid oxidation complex subunit alpha [Kangiella sediminilitoris]